MEEASSGVEWNMQHASTTPLRFHINMNGIHNSLLFSLMAGEYALIRSTRKMCVRIHIIGTVFVLAADE